MRSLLSSLTAFPANRRIRSRRRNSNSDANSYTVAQSDTGGKSDANSYTVAQSDAGGESDTNSYTVAQSDAGGSPNHQLLHRRPVRHRRRAPTPTPTPSPSPSPSPTPSPSATATATATFTPTATPRGHGHRSPTPTPTVTATATPSFTPTPSPTSTPAPTPAPPTALNATQVKADSFTAKWQSVGGATGYRLDIATSPAFVSYVAGYQNLNVGNVTSRNVSGLTPNTNYYYRLRAYNGNGTSPNSNVIQVKTKLH